MCSINGFNFKDNDLILKMNQTTKHRGSDGTGVFVDSAVSLGHNRLAIIDTSEQAAQPMKSADGNLTIIFNGEIYNFQNIKKELGSFYSWKTNSDTEVILAAYEKWGTECVKKFNGIFAFAIWDARDKKLFLARDHVGVKPLYYFWDGKKLIFSSEIKGILEHDIPRTLNQEAFNHYLRVLYVPEPLTMFDGIQKMPPATCGLLKNGVFKIKKYWGVPMGNYQSISKNELALTVKETIIGAVKRQLISDKPLGVYLSGGIDSSVVLHSMSTLRDSIDTFSVGFELSDDEQKEKFNADFNLARRTAAHYGTNHHEILLKTQEVVDNFEKAVWHMDEPISNPTALPMIVLAGFAKQKADVVLGGDGGDELFGGYERYKLSLVANYWQRLPLWFRERVGNFNKKIKKLNTPVGIARFALFMFQKDSKLSGVIRDEFFDAGAQHTKEFFNQKYFNVGSATSYISNDFEEIFMDTDRQSWLVDFSLMLTDKMSMSAGLEARVPLLDKEVVELAATIPLKEKISLFDTKIILKKAFRNDLPDFLFNEPKRGWFSPGAKWLRHPEVYTLAQEVLSREYYAPTAPLFEFTQVKKILEEHKNGKVYNLTIIWAIITFQIWAKEYKIQV